MPRPLREVIAEWASVLFEAAFILLYVLALIAVAGIAVYEVLKSLG